VLKYRLLTIAEWSRRSTSEAGGVRNFVALIAVPRDRQLL